MSLDADHSEPSMPEDPGNLHLPTPRYCWRCGTEDCSFMVPDPMQLKHDTAKLCLKCAGERETVQKRYNSQIIGSFEIIVPDGD